MESGDMWVSDGPWPKQPNPKPRMDPELERAAEAFALEIIEGPPSRSTDGTMLLAYVLLKLIQG